MRDCAGTTLPAASAIAATSSAAAPAFLTMSSSSFVYGIRDQLRTVDTTHSDDDVLLAVHHIGHRRSGLLVRHLDRPDIGAGHLVVGPKQRHSLAGLVAVHATLAGNHERLRRERADECSAGLAETRREVHTLERRIVLDVVGRRAVRLLPDDVARLHVVRRDAVVRRLDEWEALHRSAAAAARRHTASPARSRAARRRSGWWRIG